MRLRLTLPGLVDHAHAAAGDLFQQLVVAEGLPRHGPGCPAGVHHGEGTGEGARSLGHVPPIHDLLDLVAAVKVGLQLGGELGMLGQKVVAIDRFAGVQAQHVIGQEGVESLVRRQVA